MIVPLVDLPGQYAAMKAEIDEAIARVLQRQRFILGEEVTAFERELAAFTGSAHAVGVSSGTDAILASLMAVGVGPGDEVVTTPFTFASTIEGIVRLGARPRFVDLAPGSFAPAIDALEGAVGPRTRAVLFVHLYGSCFDIGDLARRLRERGVALLEDAAQAIGAVSAGRAAGTFGVAGSFSFFPTKTLGAYGDAGAIVTDDGELAARLRSLRNHGQQAKYSVRLVGGNFRLDELQAAILRAKLVRLPLALERRRQHGASLLAALAALDSDLVLPWPRPGENHAFHHFVVRTPRRDALRAHLQTEGIATEIYYPTPMHRQEAWPDPVVLPEVDRACRECLALPVHPELSEEQLDAVESAVRSFYA